MMLDSTVVCRRALGCEWEGVKTTTNGLKTKGKSYKDQLSALLGNFCTKEGTRVRTPKSQNRGQTAKGPEEKLR